MITFPVWVLMIFTYGSGISEYTWFYSYNASTNYVVKDEMTCRLGAQPTPGQYGLCVVAYDKKHFDYFCGDKIPRPCYFKVPKDLMMGRYGPVFWRPSDNQPFSFKPRIVYKWSKSKPISADLSVRQLFKPLKAK